MLACEGYLGCGRSNIGLFDLADFVDFVCIGSKLSRTMFYVDGVNTLARRKQIIIKS